MPRAGMLVQVDGSHHDWLEGRGPRLVLHAAVDDATGEVLSTVFRDEEDAWGYLFVFREIARTRGLPLAVYSDRHGIFARTPRRPLTFEEQLQGGSPPTQVGRALQEVGIRWIPASSPQAKGRIETLFGHFQDRLVSELRLAGITDRDGANAFLPDFLTRYARRFAQPAAEPEPAYRSWPAGLDPDTVFCFKYRVAVANDNTVTLGPHLVQILAGPQGRSYAKAHVEVHERLDGTVAVFYQGQRLVLGPRTPAPSPRIPARDHRRVRPKGPQSIQDLRVRTRKAAGQTPAVWKPGKDHPWRQMPVGNAKYNAAPQRTKSLNP